MLTDLILTTIGELLADVFGTDIRHWRDQRALQRSLADAIQRAQDRFIADYRDQDAALIDALIAQPGVFNDPMVHAALRDLLRHPFGDHTQPHAAVQQSFHALVPDEPDRTRVDAAVTAFLRLLGQELLDLPQIQSLYNLELQRITAMQSRDTAAHTAALRQEMQQWRESVPHLGNTADAPMLPANPPTRNTRDRPRNNLPRRTYHRFVGRHEELEKLTKLMLPYPRSRHYAVTLDGIGGVGKSALALEFAHRQRDHWPSLPEGERFDALVWVTAKRTLLTASGIQHRQQTFSTLADLHREIATVLEVPAVHHATIEQQRTLIEQALSSQRTLLIVDNLETVDDEALLTFLRELPDPTKVLVTTRHRIDIAYPLRLSGMPRGDALALLASEASNKQVDLPLDATDDLFRRTGGIPLAIVWSVGLMSMGHDVAGVVRRLGSGHSDIARFCFSESVAHIRDRDAYRLLLALALFDDSVNRTMLGKVAGLGDDEIGRDDGLAALLQLSLVNKTGDRFSLLPLTRTFALHELRQTPTLEAELRERWVEVLVGLARQYNYTGWRWRDLPRLQQEGSHLLALGAWALHHEHIDTFLSILPGLLDYYELQGQWNTLLIHATIGSEYAQLVGDSATTLYIWNYQAWIISQQGRYHEAEVLIQEGLAVARHMQDVQSEVDLLQTYSQVLRRCGRFTDATECCHRARQRLSLVPDTYMKYHAANIDYEMGKIARDQGEWDTAYALFTAARKVFREDNTDQEFDLARAWGLIGNMGFVAHQKGDLERAAEMYRQSLDFFRNNGSIGDTTTLTVRLATLEAQRGNDAEALVYARDALEWSQRLGLVQEQAQAEAVVRQLVERGGGGA